MVMSCFVCSKLNVERVYVKANILKKHNATATVRTSSSKFTIPKHDFLSHKARETSNFMRFNNFLIYYLTHA